MKFTQNDHSAINKFCLHYFSFRTKRNKILFLGLLEWNILSKDMGGVKGEIKWEVYWTQQGRHLLTFINFYVKSTQQSIKILDGFIDRWINCSSNATASFRMFVLMKNSHMQMFFFWWLHFGVVFTWHFTLFTCNEI